MFRFVFAMLLLVGFYICSPQVSKAELHVGFVKMIGLEGGWDFSDSALTWNGDIGAYTTVRASSSARVGEFLFAIPPAGIALVDSTYDLLTEAPADTNLYYGTMEIFDGDTLVIRTREGHYAKIYIESSQGQLWFDYTYQDDGSRRLTDSVPVRLTTWGGIKALYQ